MAEGEKSRASVVGRAPNTGAISQRPTEITLARGLSSGAQLSASSERLIPCRSRTPERVDGIDTRGATGRPKGGQNAERDKDHRHQG